MPNNANSIGIIQYNAGNVGSVKRALERLDIPCHVITSADQLSDTTGAIFPGAGAAGSAMKLLQEQGWVQAIKTYKKPFLGLCIGMQLLFEYSEEGSTNCLDIIPGKVRLLPDTLTRPHMGWNILTESDQEFLNDTYVYFVHSYHCEPADQSLTSMRTLYGQPICAGIQWKNFTGVQWHPEKSGETGDRFLITFAQSCK